MILFDTLTKVQNFIAMACRVGDNVVVVNLNFDGEVSDIARPKCAQWGILGTRYTFLGRVTKVGILPKSRYSRAVKNLLRNGFVREPIPEYTVEWICPLCKEVRSKKYSHPEVRFINMESISHE